MKEGKVWAEGSDPIHTFYNEDYCIDIYEDKYPVTEGHLLFIPDPAPSGYTSMEIMVADCFEEALKWGNAKVLVKDWDGFNIGLNWGEVAGQTVAWPHVHLIPRRKGDMEDPRGGVRGVIPEKQKY